MKTKFAVVLIFLSAALACGKDKFQTIPQLKLKSISPDLVPVNGNLRLRIEFTDKEGDVTDTLFVVRERLNVRGPIVLPASPYSIPDFPKFEKGEFEVNMTYQFDLTVGLSPIRVPGSNPVRNEIDSLRLKIVARDKAGNKSDTLVVNNVYVCRDINCQ